MYVNLLPKNIKNIKISVTEGTKSTLKIIEKFLTMKIETRTIAQMKGLWILLKSYKRHIDQKWIFEPLLGPQRQKITRISQNLPYLNSRFCKKYKCHTLAIFVSCKVLCYINNPRTARGIGVTLNPKEGSKRPYKKKHSYDSFQALVDIFLFST